MEQQKPVNLYVRINNLEGADRWMPGMFYYAVSNAMEHDILLVENVDRRNIYLVFGNIRARRPLKELMEILNEFEIIGFRFRLHAKRYARNLEKITGKGYCFEYVL